MLNLLKQIVKTITMLLTFIGSTIQSLADLILHIGDYTQFIIANLSLLPTVLIPFCLASLSIYVLHFILGRNNS